MYVCMYVRDRQDPVKGSGWVLFPSTMAEQPIQQLVVRASVLSGTRRTVIVILVHSYSAWANHEMGLTTSSKAT